MITSSGVTEGLLYLTEVMFDPAPKLKADFHFFDHHDSEKEYMSM